MANNARVVGFDKFDKGSFKVYVLDENAAQGKLTKKDGTKYGDHFGATCAEVMIFSDAADNCDIDSSTLKKMIANSETIPYRLTNIKGAWTCVLDEVAMMRQVMSNSSGGET